MTSFASTAKSAGVRSKAPMPRSQWKKKPLRYLCRLNPTKSEVSHLPGDTEVSFVPMDAVHEYGGLDLSQSRAIESVSQGYTYFRDDDVLIAKITPCFENGKGSIAANLEGGIGFGTTELHVLRCGEEIDPRFLFYHTLSHEFRHRGAGWMYGAGGQKRVPEEFLRNYVAVFPRLEEQRAIAAWLDDRTKRIDDLVATKRRLIELLAEQRSALITRAVTKGLNPTAPMKPSGIHWLGDMPKHWDLKRLKFASHLQTGITLGKKHDEDARKRLVLRPYLRVANVQDGWLDLDHITEIEVLPEQFARYELRPGDVLMTEGGDLDKLGRGYVWEGQIDGCLHQNHIFAVRPNPALLNSAFLAAQMASQHGRNYFTKTGQKTTNLASTNATKLGDFPVPLPPRPEQYQIMTWVTATNGRFEDLIEAADSAIELLSEHRQALITAAVTGQIQITEALSHAVEAVDSLLFEGVDPAQKSPPQKGRKANKHFQRSVLAAEIIATIGDGPTFGRVKLQKALTLAEYHLRMDEIQSEPRRAAAGPFDNGMMRSIDSQLSKSQWYEYDRSRKGGKYAALANAGGHTRYFDNYWSDRRAEFDALMRLLAKMKTEQAEIVATLYAAWNDLLLDGNLVDDEAIVTEVLTRWDPAKERIPADRWRKALDWMREKGLVPTGYGAHTKAGPLGDGV